MTMTREHFEIVACGIRREYDRLLGGGVEGDSLARRDIVGLFMTARSLADEFEEHNPRFDRARFLEACGCFPDYIGRV